jgi:predicted MFS family arabinose efflux permease
MRLLLAVPFLLFPLSPPVPLAAVLVGLSAFGYSASLPLQERLVHATRDDVRGQAFGLSTTGLQVGQATGAVLAGVLAEVFAGTRGVGLAMAAMAVMSLLVIAALVKGLRRSQPSEVPAA